MALSKDTLQVASIPVSNEFGDSQLEECFADYGPLKRCFVVRQRGKVAPVTVGYVQFAIAGDADQCLEQTKGTLTVQIEGEEKPLGLRWARDRGEAKETTKPDYDQARFDHKAAKAKKARLIVRNLSFKAQEADVLKHFGSCGSVQEVKILVKPDGKRVGCAFVQFDRVASAAQAIKKLNRTSILGRPVAVDWAIAKDQFQSGAEIKVKSEPEDENGDGSGDGEMEEDDSEDHDDGENGGTEDESDQDEDEEEDEEDGDDDGDVEGEQEEKPFKHNLKTGHDIAENKTVFIQNISFESDEEDLRDMMEENFGAVLFARFVIDKMTERPRGTAFVKFRSPESVEKAIAASEGKDGLWLDNRRIYAYKAVTKEDADQEQKKKKEKEAKDSRNLHLAVEGLVRPGTKAAEGVSKADLDKRARLEKWKRLRLKDLNMFVSPTRLCFRNIPLSFDKNEKLRKLVSKNVPATAKITECMIIKQDKGGGESKGYGFVAFQRHEDALDCLRKLNNNPKIFGKDSRPIVEFSVENRTAVNARQKRLEKSKEKNPLFKGSSKPDSKEKGKGTFKRKETKDTLEDKPDYVGSLNNPKQRNLPSHTGPKIRHTPRITRKDLKKQQEARKDPKRRKRAAQRDEANNNGETLKGQAPAKKAKKAKLDKKNARKASSKDFKEEKAFSDLVQKYKNKLNSETSIATRKKWFDS